MIKLILNDEHINLLTEEAIFSARHRLFISTADVKDLHIPGAGRRGRAVSIVKTFEQLSRRGLEIRLLHSGVPSSRFLREIKDRLPEHLEMRRCPRVHIKAMIADGRWMYLGSANLTGAGIGAKSSRRRNFEGGIWTDQTDLIDPVADMLDTIWSGAHCDRCGQRDHCPVPLEEPEL